MKGLSKASVFVLLLSMVFTTLAQDDVEGIEVFGSASVEMNEASELQILIVEQGVTAYKSALLVKQKTTQIVKGLLSAGIYQQEIQTSEITITSIAKHASVDIDHLEVAKSVNGHPLKVNTKAINHSHKGNQSTLIQASRYLVIDLKDASRVEHLYDALIKYGATDIRQVASLGDVDSYYAMALTQAFDNARAKAQDLALKVNVTLGDVIFIKELTKPNIYDQGLKKTSENIGNLDLKKNTVSADVKVRFEVK